jgi:small subunit ribosomal protein S18
MAEQVRRKRFQKRKSCKFCEDKVTTIDYKEVKLLKMYISERGKIIPRRITGNCARHQRRLTTSIKRARTIALIPFAASH